MRRREFLQRAPVAAAGAAVGVTLASGSAAAFRDVRPEHVTLSYDRARLEQFVPWVDNPPRANSDENPQDWYGWIAESPEYTYDIYVYVLKYRTQRGTSRLDSHRYDREPFYVLVWPDFDEVRRVIYTGYHWYAAHADDPPILEDSDGGEHPTAQIIAPWNHYALLETDGGAGLSKYDIEPLGDPDGGAFAEDGGQTTFESWLDTNWRSSAQPGVFQDPALMRNRDKWWRDGRETAGARAWRTTQLALARAGVSSPRLVGGAAESDLL